MNVRASKVKVPTLLPVLLLALLGACGQSNPKPQVPPSAEEATAAKSVADPNISGVYVGNIDNDFAVVLSLESKDGTISGSYFYKKIGTDIALSGTQTGKSFSLTERDEKGRIDSSRHPFAGNLSREMVCACFWNR